MVSRKVRHADYWTESRSLSVTTWIEFDEAKRRENADRLDLHCRAECDGW
ncbi:hypothetical protein GCM10023113_20550 [Cellulomonas oligotrophica]|uniref:Uncharacterized protein n=1 Tax=Cellulomonas oligotrophica TaxID=931536 RepID=A0ABQ4DFF7_9CELL|nr:hypothetical protein Col01nite_36220 [Cellulomonas oligotrophica]